jgi:hypothetical protein
MFSKRSNPNADRMRDEMYRKLVERPEENEPWSTLDLVVESVRAFGSAPAHKPKRVPLG